MQHKTIRVTALAPDMQIRVGDDLVHVGPLHARIIAVLMAAGRPMTTDELIDVVWPGVDPQMARRRLATALYRLRRQLGISERQLVIREPGGLRLAAPDEGFSSDVDDLLDADPDDRKAAEVAALLYSSDFCARQLAYDEGVFELRRWLRARFVLLCRRSLEQHVELGAYRAGVRLALHVRTAVADDPELAMLAATVLERAARGEEAWALVQSASDALSDGALEGGGMFDMFTARLRPSYSPLK